VPPNDGRFVKQEVFNACQTGCTAPLGSTQFVMCDMWSAGTNKSFEMFGYRHRLQVLPMQALQHSNLAPPL
jgi:hypothetical protein